MNITRKRFIVVIGFIFAIIVSNFIGGFIGFKKGYEARLYQEGLDAISNVMILNLLRDGKTDSATHMLEIKLDWQIFNVGSYEKAHGNLYNLDKYSPDIDIKKLENSVMKKVVEYRSEHPCRAKYDFETDWCDPENEIRKIINNTIKKHESQNKTRYERTGT